MTGACSSLAGVEHSCWPGVCKREEKKRSGGKRRKSRWERREGEIHFEWRRVEVLLQLLPLLPFSSLLSSTLRTGYWDFSSPSEMSVPIVSQLWASRKQSGKFNFFLMTHICDAKSISVEWGGRKREWVTLSADVLDRCWLDPDGIYCLCHPGRWGQPLCLSWRMS